MDKLVDGRIPAGQECPFRSKCEIAQVGGCKHMGKEAPKPFSCASARLFNIMKKD